jgi:hypothetical protein
MGARTSWSILTTLLLRSPEVAQSGWQRVAFTNAESYRMGGFDTRHGDGRGCPRKGSLSKDSLLVALGIRSGIHTRTSAFAGKWSVSKSQQTHFWRDVYDSKVCVWYTQVQA